MVHNITIPKTHYSTLCEDASFSYDTCIAVSDGAGGSGLFADEWAQYILDKLSKDKAICSADELHAFIDEIWEPFYNEHEEIAKEQDGIFQNKYYDEGSCATLAAFWKDPDIGNKYLCYGDSMVFFYDTEKKELIHSTNIERLSDFEKNPYLLSTIDPIVKEKVCVGEFQGKGYVFIASDALSHYILMMYEALKSTNLESTEATINHTESIVDKNEDKDSIDNSTYSDTFSDFYSNVLKPLLDSSKDENSFAEYIYSLRDKNLIDIDDYSLAYMEI